MRVSFTDFWVDRGDGLRAGGGGGGGGEEMGWGGWWRGRSEARTDCCVMPSLPQPTINRLPPHPPSIPIPTPRLLRPRPPGGDPGPRVLPAAAVGLPGPLFRSGPLGLPVPAAQQQHRRAAGRGGRRGGGGGVSVRARGGGAAFVCRSNALRWFTAWKTVLGIRGLQKCSHRILVAVSAASVQQCSYVFNAKCHTTVQKGI